MNMQIHFVFGKAIYKVGYMRNVKRQNLLTIKNSSEGSLASDVFRCGCLMTPSHEDAMSGI